MDEMGDGSELSGDLFEYAFYIGFDRHIPLHRDGGATGRFDRGDHAGGGIGVAVIVHRDVITGGARELGGGGADAATTTGDQQNGLRHDLFPSLYSALPVRPPGVANRPPKSKARSRRAPSAPRGPVRDWRLP